jgi:hypothetical protein
VLATTKTKKNKGDHTTDNSRAPPRPLTVSRSGEKTHYDGLVRRVTAVRLRTISVSEKTDLT